MSIWARFDDGAAFKLRSLESTTELCSTVLVEFPSYKNANFAYNSYFSIPQLTSFTAFADRTVSITFIIWINRTNSTFPIIRGECDAQRRGCALNGSLAECLKKTIRPF